MYKITVLMSVYNGEKYLRDSIDSILNQTFKDFEFLIINDGSTDNSLKILNSYDDNRIKIVNNETNIGLVNSLNKGLRIAKGKYIARQDDGDYSYPDRLQKEYNFLEHNKDYALVGTLTEVIDENNNTIKYWDKVRSAEEIYYLLSFRNILTNTSVMFEKKLVLEIGGYNGLFKFSQDYELGYRISRRKKVYIIPEVLVKWRKDTNGISVRYGNDQKYFARKLAMENYDLDENLYNYLRFNTKGRTFFINLKMFIELCKFHKKIKEESKNIDLNSKELNMIFSKVVRRFLIDNFLSSNLKNFLKKIIRKR